MICRQAKYSNESLNEALTRGVPFERSHIVGIDFRAGAMVNSDLQYTSISQCSFENMRFESCDFRGAEFSECRFSMCYFQSCNFNSTNFTLTILEACTSVDPTFVGTILLSSKFGFEPIDHVDLSSVLCNSETQWPQWVIDRKLNPLSIDSVFDSMES